MTSITNNAIACLNFLAVGVLIGVGIFDAVQIILIIFNIVAGTANLIGGNLE